MKKHYILFVLFAVVLIGGTLRFYNLGEKAFDRDEFFELNSSYGYFMTGKYVAWDFGKNQPFPDDMQDDTSNERAEIFRWQLAQLYRFQEPTEFLTRALGSAWGVLAIVLIYFVTLSMTGNKYVALIAAFLAAVGESEITYSRRLRMYAMLYPVYLAFSWAVYKFYESKYKGKVQIFKWINEKIGFNPAYLLPVLIIGFISYDTHVLSINIAAAIAAYAGLLFVSELFLKKKISLSYMLTTASVVAGLIVLKLGLIAPLSGLVKKNVFLFESNYDFFNLYFTNYAHVYVGLILFVAGAWYLAHKMKRPKEAIFLASSAAVPLVLAIFTWRRDVSQRYIFFIQPFSIMLSAVGVYGIVSLVAARFSRWKKPIIFLLFAASLLLIDFSYFSRRAEVFTSRKNSYYPNFEVVFNYVRENKKPGDILITRMYRSYYWRGEQMQVFDLRKLGAETGNCKDDLEAVVNNYPSGWVVFPKVDKISFCPAGRRFLESKMTEIDSPEIPSSVLIYKWGK